MGDGSGSRDSRAHDRDRRARRTSIQHLGMANVRDRSAGRRSHGIRREMGTRDNRASNGSTIGNREHGMGNRGCQSSNMGRISNLDTRRIRLSNRILRTTVILSLLPTHILHGESIGASNRVRREPTNSDRDNRTDGNGRATRRRIHGNTRIRLRLIQPKVSGRECTGIRGNGTRASQRHSKNMASHGKHSNSRRGTGRNSTGSSSNGKHVQSKGSKVTGSREASRHKGKRESRVTRDTSGEQIVTTSQPADVSQAKRADLFFFVLL